jgi:acyl carrier protein
VTQTDNITEELIKHIYENYPTAKAFSPLPLDKSLLEIGALDSFGIIELVSFIESKWSIQIYDSELTMERFGGINKMASVIRQKLKIEK